MAAVHLEIVEVSLRSHSTGRAGSLPFMVLCSSQLVWIRAAAVNPERYLADDFEDHYKP